MKHSPLVASSPVDHPASLGPTENTKPYLQNRAIPLEAAIETSQETIATSQLPASSEKSHTPTTFTSSAPEESVEDPPALLGTDKATLESDLDAPVVRRAPASELHEEPHPAIQQQTAEKSDQASEKDNNHDSELTNGINSSEPRTTDQDLHTASLEQSEVAPASTEDLMDVSTPIGKTLPSTGDEPPHRPPLLNSTGAEEEAPNDPVPSSAAPAEIQLEGQTEDQSPKAPSHESSNDQTMQNAPQSPSKVARPREIDDDAENEPALKRPKTDAEELSAPEFKKPELSEASPNASGVQSPHGGTSSAAQPTVPQHKHMLRVLGNVKRAKDAMLFIQPVDAVKANVPTYYSVITSPMDISTMELKLKDHRYASIDAFISDFNQIIANTEKFNGREHAVTQSAYRMRTSFSNQMNKMPGPEVPEQGASDKKKRPSVSTTDKPMPPRRESRSSLPSSARPPLTPASPQTFALNPQGVPLIRRDSAADGRPKREIHPPAPRDLPYANQKPKKKKFYWELKFAETVLGELKKPRFAQYSSYFLAPVDPVALNIPDYHKIIKKPMDLGTVESKLKQGEYENFKEFEADVRLIFSNCYKFNPPGNVVHLAGKEIEQLFDSKLKDKDTWIKNNTPASEPASPGSSPEGSDEEDEEDEDEDEQASDEVRKLQEQIAAMAKKVELLNQKKKSPPAPTKKVPKPAPKGDKKSTKKAAPQPSAKTKASAKSGYQKDPFVSYEDKQDISNRINELDETKMSQALNIIRHSMPNLKVRPGICKVFLRFKWQTILNLSLYPPTLVKAYIMKRTHKATNLSLTLTSYLGES